MPVTFTSNLNTNGFLSNTFPHSPPRLYFTAEDDDFDDETLQEWREEGFQVDYVPMERGGKAYGERLNALSRAGLGVGETFAIIAYGDAASFCLEHYLHPGTNKICALVAYYPTAIPDTRNTRFPSSIRILVHLAGSTVGVNRTQQLLGIQGKRRTIQRRINPGIGTGGTLKIAYPSYTYDHAEPGFAEHDLDEYERVPAELAWSRTLDVLRRAFRKDVDLEKVWEENVENKFFTRSTTGTLQTLTTQKQPRVTYAPTLTGGIGADQLRRFSEDLFIPSNPPSLRMRLLSRTIGADRVVDELHMSFKHSQSMPWILPGIPATDRQVEVIVISIVCIRGGKLYSEHVYWDQASVLLQVGLLDPKLMPERWKGKGVHRLPVFGQEAARRILDGDDGRPMNELVPGWGSRTSNKRANGEEEWKAKEEGKKEEEEEEEKEEEEELNDDDSEVEEQAKEAEEETGETEPHGGKTEKEIGEPEPKANAAGKETSTVDKDAGSGKQAGANQQEEEATSGRKEAVPGEAKDEDEDKNEAQGDKVTKEREVTGTKPPGPQEMDGKEDK